MFEFNTADPIDFAKACSERNVNCQILRNGLRAKIPTPEH
jgi:hypothetical protein